MQREEAIGLALARDYDIIEACPNILDMEVGKVEKIVDVVVEGLYRRIDELIKKKGSRYLKKKDHVGLCRMLERNGVPIPAAMLGKMCDTIISFMGMEIRAEVSQPGVLTPVGPGVCATAESATVYWIKMDLDIRN